jgi:hypothetical protein
MTLIQGYRSLCSQWFKHCPGHNFSLRAWIGIIITELSHLTQRSVMTLIQGHYQRSRSLYTIWLRHRQIVCPSHNFWLSSWIGIIFHGIVTLDSRKCHDLDPKSLVKGQGHYTHRVFLRCPSHNFSMSLWIGMIFNRIVTLGPGKCHDHDSRL